MDKPIKPIAPKNNKTAEAQKVLPVIVKKKVKKIIHVPGKLVNIITE